MTALARAYSRFNRLYFANALPPDLPVRWSRKLPSSMYGCHSEEGILIHAQLRPFWEVAMMTLLHEMAHEATKDERDSHGPRWRREMRRLMRLGAFDEFL